MRKSKVKDGVGQLVLQIAFPGETQGPGETQAEANDRVGETEDNGPKTSSAPSGNGSEIETIAVSHRGKPIRRTAGAKRKWYSLMDKVWAASNLEQAWKRVKSNRGAAGNDGITITMFAQNADEQLLQLQEDLKRKTFQPKAVRRVYIPKSGGGKRPLGIPTVRDRVVQQALLQVLSPIFEAKFSSRSHVFRPEKGCATALNVVDQAIKCGYQWVVDADIQTFFDTVDHQKLLAAINEEISDGSVLRLINRILQAGVIEPAVPEVEPTDLGTPQGGPLSPLLANIYLHSFDEKIAAGGYGLIRYADDFVIFTKSESEAQAALTLSREILEGELGLQMHPEKTRVVSVDEGFEFLGYHYYRDPKHGMLLKEVRHKSVKSFRDNVRKRTPRIKNQRKPKARHMTAQRLRDNPELAVMIRRLNAFMRGWHWYFKAVRSPYKTPFRNFDSYLRQRIRQAVVGRTGSGWWNSRIHNRLLRSLGLMSLDEMQKEYLQGQLIAPARKG
jgi:RNA-directed DNA polymerase